MAKDFRIYESMETMESIGANAVTTEDLLAIILGNREKAERLLRTELTLFSGQKEGLRILSSEDFDGIKHLGRLTNTETARVLAAIEVGKRIAHMPATECQHISSPGDAAAYLQKHLSYETHEKFFVLLLNTKNRVIRVKQISEGSLTSSIVGIKEVLAAAITGHAACMIVAHSHPSSDPTPSTCDRELSRALALACETVSIPLIDHIVLGCGSNRYYSFKEHGDL